MGRAKWARGVAVVDRIDALDEVLSRSMERWGIGALRLALALVFVWFGILKPFGLSPAEPLVLATVTWIPVLEPLTWLALIGWWEVAIGVTFLFHATLRLAIALLAIQMGGVLLPLVMLPDVTFQAGHAPYAPTLEGQYIIKNVVIIAAALVVGGTARSGGGRRRGERRSRGA